MELVLRVFALPDSNASTSDPGGVVVDVAFQKEHLPRKRCTFYVDTRSMRAFVCVDVALQELGFGD